MTWPFNDPFAGPAVILLVAAAIGWIDDKIEAFRSKRQ